MPEDILKELQTSQNDLKDGSASSDVYIGKNWVKKVSNDGKYSHQEMLQFELMTKYPKIFPKTIIRKNNGKVVILQQKVNVEKAVELYRELISSCGCGLEGSIKSFRTFLEHIAVKGDSFLIKTTMKCYIDILIKNHKQRLIGNLKLFINAAARLHQVLKQNNIHTDSVVDLNINNFGFDEHNNLKIIDFLI